MFPDPKDPIPLIIDVIAAGRAVYECPKCKFNTAAPYGFDLTDYMESEKPALPMPLHDSGKAAGGVCFGRCHGPPDPENESGRPRAKW